GRPVRRRDPAAGRPAGHRRRGLPDLLDDGSAGAGAPRLRAGDALVPGPVDRGAGRRAVRVHPPPAPPAAPQRRGAAAGGGARAGAAGPAATRGRGVIDYLNNERGLRSWLLPRDHRRIGVMCFVAITLSLILGGVFALLLRLELLTPERDVFGELLTYNRMFTHHGIVMVFLFLVPSIPTVFGNFALPIMLGAEDVAFPRLNLASFYVYVIGAVIVLASLMAGGVDTGWTFYVPYSGTSPTAVGMAAFGVFVVGIS